MSDEAEVLMQPAAFSGEVFSEARQKLGLSVEQVARQLHLSEAVINSIEQAAFEELKDPVFSRGYIRSYARFLKLDADALVTAYNRQTGNESTTGQVRAIGTVSMVPGRRQGHPVLKVGSWLFLLALIAASVWWWQTQFGFDAGERAALDDLPVSVETSDGTTLVLPQLNEMDVEEDVAAVAPLQPTLEAEVDVQDAVDWLPEEPAGQVEPERQPAADEPAEQAETDTRLPAPFAGLVLSFAEDCWLSVKDARGRALYSGVAKGGSSLELDGDEPLAVVIGRVSAVAEIRYDNKPIELASISKDNVARLRLPL